MNNIDTKYGWFCSTLYRQIYSDIDGNWRPCCYGSKEHSREGEKTIYNTKPLEYFLSDEMNEYRRMTLSGEVPDVCVKCKRYEDQGFKSYRQMENEHPNIDDILGSADHFIKTGKIKFEKRFIYLKLKIFGNYCNLKCFMCHPHNSSSRQTELISMSKKYDYDFLKRWGQPKTKVSIEKTLQYTEVIEEVIKMSPYIESLEIIGGEPLMMKNHYDLLDRLVETDHAKDIKLKYVTNLTKLKHGNRNFLHYIQKFKDSNFNISIDGIYERGEWLRYGLAFDEFIDNLNSLRDETNNISLAFTASNLSILYATEMYDYFTFEQRMRIKYMDRNIVTEPQMLDPRHLPDNLKQRLINEFENHVHAHKFKGLVELLKNPRDESLFDLGMKYIKTVNDFRKTNVGELFPELKQHIETAEMDFYNDPEHYLREMGKPIH